MTAEGNAGPTPIRAGRTALCRRPGKAVRRRAGLGDDDEAVVPEAFDRDRLDDHLALECPGRVAPCDQFSLERIAPAIEVDRQRLALPGDEHAADTEEREREFDELRKRRDRPNRTTASLTSRSRPGTDEQSRPVRRRLARARRGRRHAAAVAAGTRPSCRSTRRAARALPASRSRWATPGRPPPLPRSRMRSRHAARRRGTAARLSRRCSRATAAGSRIAVRLIAVVQAQEEPDVAVDRCQLAVVKGEGQVVESGGEGLIECACQRRQRRGSRAGAAPVPVPDAHGSDPRRRVTADARGAA